jgi:hypothetical protein
LKTLQIQASKLREEKEAAEKVTEELRHKYLEMERGSSMARNKLNEYAGEGIDMEALDKALTMVKRRTEAVNRLDFLEDPDDPTSNDHVSLKRKLQDVRITMYRCLHHLKLICIHDVYLDHIGSSC